MNAPTRTTATSVSWVFDRVAKVYDSPWLQQFAYRPVQDLVLEELRVRKPERVLDVGCGTGILADRIQRELTPVTTYGCDPSTGMLAEARSRSTAVEWLEGTAEAIPLPDASVDAVVSTTAFHFFDQPAALAEFARVLRPGGSVVVAAAATHADVTAALLEPLAQLPTGRVPSERQLRKMFEDAGLTVHRQVRPIRLGLRNVDPMVVTIGKKD